MNSIFKSSLGELFPHKSTFVPRLELEFSPVDLKLLSINRMVHNNLPRLPYQNLSRASQGEGKKTTTLNSTLPVRKSRFPPFLPSSLLLSFSIPNTLDVDFPPLYASRLSLPSTLPYSSRRLNVNSDPTFEDGQRSQPLQAPGLCLWRRRT